MFSQSKVNFLPGSCSFLHYCDSLVPKLCDCPEVSGNEEGWMKREAHIRKDCIEFSVTLFVVGTTSRLMMLTCTVLPNHCSTLPITAEINLSAVTESSHQVQELIFWPLAAQRCSAAVQSHAWGWLVWLTLPY